MLKGLDPEQQEINLTLTLDPFMVGDSVVNFELDRVNPEMPASGTVEVTDVAGNTCTIDISQPSAKIDISEQQPDGSWLIISPDPGSGTIPVDECQVVQVSGAGSGAGQPSGLLFLEWDVTDPPDFAAVDAYEQSFELAWISDGGGPCGDVDCTDYDVALQVTEESTSMDAATEKVRVQDLAPVEVSVFGPKLVEADQVVCYVAGSNSTCDSIDVFDWDFEARTEEGGDPGDPFESEGNPGSEICTSWSAPGTYWIGARAVDSDGDGLIGELAVEVVSPSAALADKSQQVQIDCRLLSYDPVVVGGQVHQHTEIALINVSEFDVRGPFYIRFENVLPSAATLVDDLNVSDPVLELAGERPIAVPGSTRLMPMESTPVLSLEWHLPEAAADAFTYDAVIYAPQLPPVFEEFPETLAFEGSLYQSSIRASDPEGDPVHYEFVGSPPEGMHLNAATGAISWIPGESVAVGDPHLIPITIRARDGFTDSDTDYSFNLEVVAVNRWPVIESQPATLAAAGDTYVYSIVATDIDQDMLEVIVNATPQPTNFTTSTISSEPGRTETEIRWDPVDAATNKVDIAILVLDGEGGFAEQSYTLSVTTCTNRPVLEQIVADTAYEGLPYLRQLELASGDPNEAYYFLESPPDGMTVTPNGLLQWTPSYTDHGLELIKVIVSTDPTGNLSVDPVNRCSDSMVFPLTVEDRNASPVFLTMAETTATEGVPYVYDANAWDADDDELRFDLLDAPEGMSIHPISGVLSWRPSQTAAINGPYSFKVRVRDAADAYAEQPITLDVQEVDVPPVFDSVSVRSVVVDETYQYQVFAHDPDAVVGNGIADYAASITPEDPMFAIDAGGLITWPVGPEDLAESPFRVVVQVTDETGNIARQPFDLVVRFAPFTADSSGALTIALADPPQHYAVVGASYVQDVLVTDEDQEDDGAAFSYLIVALDEQEDAPEGASPSFDNIAGSNDGRISWTPDSIDLGKTFWLGVRVDDDQGHLDYLTYPVWVVDEDPTGSSNVGPRVVSDPIFSAVAGEEYRYDIVVVDPDLDEPNSTEQLVYALEPGLYQGQQVPPPAGMTLDSAPTTDPTHPILWTPTEEQVGVHWVQFRVTDLTGSSSVRGYELTVVSGGGRNRPPEIVSVPGPSAEVEVLYEYAVEVEDPDVDDIHRFSLRYGPSGATIDRFSGLVSWVPAKGQVGSVRFVVRATDSQQAYDEQEFVVAVSPSGTTPLNEPPRFDSSAVTAVEMGSTYAYQVTYSDPESDDMIFTLEHAPVGLVASSSPGVTVNYKYDKTGRLNETLFQDAAHGQTSTVVKYDKAGRKKEEIDQNNRVTRYEYDPAGRLTAVVDARNGRTEYEYDEFGNRILQRDAESRETKMAYDSLGRMVKRVLPLGQVERFTHDGAGNMIAHTNFNSETITFEHFDDGRLKKKFVPDPLNVGQTIETAFDYTAGGQRASAGGDTYTYDERGRLSVSEQGRNVHFIAESPTRRTAEFLIDGAARTGSGGLKADVYFPEAGKTAKGILDEIVAKADQAESVLVDMSRTSLSIDDVKWIQADLPKHTPKIKQVEFYFFE